MPIIRLKNKQELIKAARIHLVRYFAFTNHINYLNAETICVMNGFRKMDTKESTAYYIKRGWMEGEPLKPHGTYVNNCRFVADRQCAIIAHCPFPSVMQLYNDIREEDDIDFKSRYRFLRKGASDDRFLVIARALNAYCRCHPETLAVFSEMDDIPVVMPDDEEQKKALSSWNEAISTMTSEDLQSIDPAPFQPILFKKEFLDFFRSIPGTLILRLTLSILMKYQKYQLLTDEQAEYLLQLSETAINPFEQPVFDEVRDHVLFYHHFLRHGHIEEHLAEMHQHTKPFALLSAIQKMQERKANEAVKILQKYLKLHKQILFTDCYANFIYLSAILQDATPKASEIAATLAKKKILELIRS